MWRGLNTGLALGSSRPSRTSTIGRYVAVRRDTVGAGVETNRCNLEKNVTGSPLLCFMVGGYLFRVRWLKQSGCQGQGSKPPVIRSAAQRDECDTGCSD